MTKKSLILFAHGARDPRWAGPFQRLQQLLQIQRPELNVALAFLELMEPRLPATVEQLAREGSRQITVVPVFLGQGGHVLRDLPLLIDQLRSTLPEIELDVAPAVGEDAEVLNAIAAYCLSAVESSPSAE